MIYSSHETTPPSVNDDDDDDGDGDGVGDGAMEVQTNFVSSQYFTTIITKPKIIKVVVT